MTLSFFPISKNKLNIPANGFIDVELLTPGDKSYYLQNMFCNKKEIGVELKDDSNNYMQEPLNANYFSENFNTDFKIVFGTGVRLRVRLHNFTDTAMDNLSFSLIGYKVSA